MSLYSKIFTYGKYRLVVAVARTKTVGGGVRYSQRIEFQRSGDDWHIECDQDDCDSTSFRVDELVWGCITLFCTECGNKMPLADDGHVYADFGSGDG